MPTEPPTQYLAESKNSVQVKFIIAVITDAVRSQATLSWEQSPLPQRGSGFSGSSRPAPLLVAAHVC